ncbi:hypothetical protein EZS27_015550 [termite gut metagenome]|uniref:DUF5056 domain-containing protein n=1 Tax=termite gut metagenome TaxID=433724 RepID=A0A5J4RQS4_9ZZZZ
MDTEQSINHTFKQILENRMKGELPSNFTYRMMQQIQLEAERQHHRKKVTGLLSLLTACLLLISLAVYILVFYMELNLSDYISYFKISLPSSQLMDFYSYIGLLTLGLLGIDYWFREKRKNRQHRSAQKNTL